METGSWKNKLYFGDNLDILREHVASENVDLIYLDPPFNSNASYNVLFQEKSGEKSAAQITAFEDTWHWGMESEYAYQEIVKEGPKKLSDLIQALRMFLGQNDMMAYLTMMAQRMVELHRVLKPTGSIYLHCDPAAMRLLVVVDKLLVGFDAPPCSYLYIDKSMQDHGLFQAICRVNRLDGEDKQFGYIIDYKDLFKKVENAVAVYTSELDYDTFDKPEVDILLKDRLEKSKERLDKATEEITLLCEPVEPPRDWLAYQRYFCGNPENKADLEDTETQRMFLYKDTVALIRAYANIAGEMEEAGYSPAEIDDIKQKVDFYLNLREQVRNASGEKLDTKAYEADMRHLIDTYIQADDPRKISPFDGMSLLDIIVNSGIGDAIASLPDGIKNNKEAVAETIINNVRKKIIEEHLIDPAYFEDMSRLLDEIIKERKANAISYEEYLNKIAELSKRVVKPVRDGLPDGITTSAQIALYNNTGQDADLAKKLHGIIIRERRADWRGNPAKENEIKAGLYNALKDKDEVERIFPIIKEQSEY